MLQALLPVQRLELRVGMFTMVTRTCVVHVFVRVVSYQFTNRIQCASPLCFFNMVVC